jgi:hypothetical protein
MRPVRYGLPARSEIYQRLGMPQAEQVTERLAEIAIPEQRRTSGLRA